MAIIGKLNTLRGIFSQDLENLYKFLESCVNGCYKKTDFKQNARVELESGIFAMLQTYKLNPSKKAFFESHKKYVDFQLTIKGNECFMIGDSQDFNIKKSYNEKIDVIAYNPRKDSHRILSFAQSLCIFMPNDVHAGGLKHKALQKNYVYKVVAKVPINLIGSCVFTRQTQG